MSQTNPFQAARKACEPFPDIAHGDVDAVLLVAALIENFPYGHGDIQIGDIPKMWETFIRDLWHQVPGYRDSVLDSHRDDIRARRSPSHLVAIQRVRDVYREARRK